MVPSMESPRVPPLARFIARLVGGGRTDVRALQNVLALQGAVRFTVLMGITVLVPAILLSWFALSDIRAEELYFDAETERGADAAAAKMLHEIDARLSAVESATIDRLNRGQPPVIGLAELSPYLRAALVLDDDGKLVAPLTLDAIPELAPPNGAYRHAFGDGQIADLRGRYDEAAAAYRNAARYAADPVRAGTASFAQARSLSRAGRTGAADRAYQDVYADYTNVRDERGFLFGDLASLQRIRLASDPDTRRVALEEIVQRLLDPDTRWVIGQGGEAALASAAIDELDGKSDPYWVAQARQLLDDRLAQMRWVEERTDELELFDIQSQDVDGKFNYFPTHESDSLWTTVTWEDRTYIFSWDYGGLIGGLQDAIRRDPDLDPSFTASLLRAKTAPPTGVLVREQLPKLTDLNLAVAPADPASLDAQKRQRRTVRSIVVFLAVGMSVIGIVLAGRMLAAELEIARMKTDFAANVSHELRSPITQIRLKGEALQLDLVFDDADRQAHYDAIVREAERLSRLVDNVLDFAAIETGAKKYTFRPEDIGEILTNSVDSARGALEAQGLRVTITIADHLPVVWVDREALGQVIQNLLSNAAKYGADGGWIGVSADLDGDNVAVSVSDGGMGIKPADLDKIWDRFYRSSDPKVRRKRGTGIGLPIVRYIVEAHGGEITVDSAVGRGTTFTFTLPLAPRDTGA